MVQRRIEWPDTDASGNYHNTAAFRFIEVAETALLERLGMLDDIYGRLPRRHVEADFLQPLVFRDLVDITLSVASVGRTSVTYDFELCRAGEPAVRGRAASSAERGQCLRKRLAQYPRPVACRSARAAPRPRPLACLRG